VYNVVCMVTSQNEDRESETSRLKSEVESLQTRLTLERSERGKMESVVSRRDEELAGVKVDLKQTLDSVATKDLVILDLSQQLEVLRHEVWYSAGGVAKLLRLVVPMRTQTL